MELVLPMYNVHPYFSLKNLGKKVCIISGKTWYSETINQIVPKTHSGLRLNQIPTSQTVNTLLDI